MQFPKDVGMIQGTKGCWVHFKWPAGGGLPESAAKLVRFKRFRCLTAAEAKHNSKADAAIDVGRRHEVVVDMPLTWAW